MAKKSFRMASALTSLISRMRWREGWLPQLRSSWSTGLLVSIEGHQAGCTSHAIGPHVPQRFHTGAGMVEVAEDLGQVGADGPTASDPLLDFVLSGHQLLGDLITGHMDQRNSRAQENTRSVEVLSCVVFRSRRPPGAVSTQPHDHDPGCNIGGGEQRRGDIGRRAECQDVYGVGIRLPNWRETWLGAIRGHRSRRGYRHRGLGDQGSHSSAAMADPAR